MSESIDEIIFEDHKIRIEKISPEPDEMAAIIYRFTITPSDGSKFRYRMAIAEEAMIEISRGVKRVGDPF